MREYDVEWIRRSIKQKKKKVSPKKNLKIPFCITKFLILVILTLVAMICLKKDLHFQSVFYKKVYETNFSFATINSWYEDKFGSPIPFLDYLNIDVEPVFHEKLKYENVEDYLDGAKLKVQKKYLVPIKTTGLVVFAGEKEGYGKTVIIQQKDGIDVWYGNLEQINVNLYDYVKEGSLLGEVKEDTLYLVFKKEGNILDYHEYL